MNSSFCKEAHLTPFPFTQLAFHYVTVVVYIISLKCPTKMGIPHLVLLGGSLLLFAWNSIFFTSAAARFQIFRNLTLIGKDITFNYRICKCFRDPSPLLRDSVDSIKQITRAMMMFVQPSQEDSKRGFGWVEPKISITAAAKRLMMPS